MLAATTTRKRGTLGVSFFITVSATTVATPMPTVSQCHSLKCSAAWSTISCTWWLRGMFTPSMCLSWDRPMIRAAALVKPATTGWERKLTRNPRRAIPMPSCMTPTMAESITA